MLHLLTTTRDCRHCGFQVNAEHTACPRCHDNGMSRFSMFHAMGVALLVAGALSFHFYPELAGLLTGLAGSG